MAYHDMHTTIIFHSVDSLGLGHQGITLLEPLHEIAWLCIHVALTLNLGVKRQLS